MSSNDLLSYSIMNINYNKPCQYDTIKLPPILNHKLTENNLISHQNQTFNQKFEAYYYRSSSSKSSSVSSMSSVGDSPLTPKSPSKSPNFLHPSMAKEPVKELTPMVNSDEVHDQVNDQVSDQIQEEEKKRRQRSGPSCDACRSRKVKCNAEIIILSTCSQNFDYSSFPAGTFAGLSQGEVVKLDDFNLIISNDKLIKFRPCKSCNNKHLDCKFSKGFTKEDILINKKNSTKIEKKIGDRKSSCLSCRRRKIKCAMIGNKCENCIKKGSDCQVMT